MDIFEYATREHLRWPSAQGQLTVEDLWNLPLTTSVTGRASLDSVGREIRSQLTELNEGSLVASPNVKKKKKFQAMFDIVVSIIKTKQDEAAALREKAENIARANKLKEVLASKQDKKIEELSEEEIRAEISKLQQSAED